MYIRKRIMTVIDKPILQQILEAKLKGEHPTIIQKLQQQLDHEKIKNIQEEKRRG
jgi:hypothetical protein